MIVVQCEPRHARPHAPGLARDRRRWPQRHRPRAARCGRRSTCPSASSSSSSSTPSRRPRPSPVRASSSERTEVDTHAGHSATHRRSHRRGGGQPSAVRHQPARARLRPHARQLAAPHPAVVDPGRRHHPGPLRRRPPRVRHHRRGHRGRHRHHLEPQGPRAASVHSDEPVTLRLDVRGPGDVTAADIQTTADVEILNPTCTSPPSTARAAWPSTSPSSGAAATSRPTATRAPATIGVIPVDSIFSPVRRVTFLVEPTRVEQSTNYDRLVLDIETDGSITPREALASAGATLQSLVQLVDEMSDEPQGLELGEVSVAAAGSPDLDLPIEDLDLSERPRNCLKRAQVNTVGELLEQERGRPAGHHQLRSEVARRGHREARRAGPRAPHRDWRPTCLQPQEGPPLRRQRRAPAADDGQPGRVAHRRRGHRHHRGQGQGPAPGRREDHHQGQEGRPAQPPSGRRLPRRQGDGRQAVRRDRPPLRRAPRWLHPHPEARPPPGRQRPMARIELV